jgi:DNA-binding FadR family transcriptional regulator
MKRLGEKGLVEIRPRLGTRVLPRNQWNILDPDVLTWQQEAPPSLEVLLQLREVRGILEPGAVVLAAARRDDEDIEKIMSAYGRMEANVSDPAAFAVADAEFHSEILRTADNEYLDAIGALISTDLLSSIKVTNPDTEKNIRSLKFHLNVAKGIAAGDADKAQKAMHVLLEDAGRRLRKARGKIPVAN